MGGIATGRHASTPHLAAPSPTRLTSTSRHSKWGRRHRSVGRHRRGQAECLTKTALLTPFLLVGFLFSGPARRQLDNGRTPPAVLAVAATSAALLIRRSVLSSA